MSKSSFHDQGKDVSRALRNRCLQIVVNFDDKEIHENSSGMIDGRFSQIIHDLKPNIYENDQEFIGLRSDLI